MVGFLTFTQYLQITHKLNPEDYPRRANSCREILDFLEAEYQASLAAQETFNFWMSDEGGNSMGNNLCLGCKSFL